MRVLYVIPAIAPRYGGPSRAIVGICQAMQRQGIETLIATTDADGASRLGVSLEQIVDYKGIPTIFFRRQWSEALKYSRPLAFWLEAHVSDFDIVDINAVFSHSSIAAARACGRHRTSYLIRPHGTLDPWGVSRKRLRKSVLWNVAVREMLANAGAIHYTAAEERRRAESTLGLRRGVVIPLGVDNEALDSGEETADTARGGSPDRPYVLFLSRLHPKKGLELLIRAFLHVVKNAEFRHWRLVIAGSGEQRYVASLRTLSDDSGAPGSIEFPGWLDGAERLLALRGAAVLALTSHQENFGLAMIEAMACGVPVLASANIDLARDIKEAGAGWIVPLDLACLTATLADVMRNETEQAMRGRAARELVRSRFRWSGVGAQLSELYRSLANQSSTAG